MRDQQKLESIKFKNSETCEGVVYTDPNSPLDISKIEIRGRYPEIGWAKNETVHEIVYVDSGLGAISLRHSGIISLQEGDSVYVEPGEWFAWEGNMTLIMACTPPFNPGQYVIEEGDDEI